MLGAVLALGAAGCVITPHSRTVVAARTQSITFSGYFSPYGSPIAKIQISVLDGDHWTEIGSPTDINASSGAWSVTVPVLGTYWTAPCNAATFKATTVDAAVPVLAYDQYCLDLLPPGSDARTRQVCLQPNIVLTKPQSGPVSYTPPGGELSLAGPDESERYRCVTTLVGDLTIDGGARPTGPFYYRGVVVALPALTEVTGKLTINGNHAERISFPQLQHVGTSPGVTTGMKVTLNRFLSVDTSSAQANPPPKAIYNTLETPLLASVGGILELHNVADSGVTSDAQLHYPFGLDAVTQVGGVLAVDEACPPSGIDGLAGLTNVAGDVTLEWRQWELYGGLLTNLTHIDGNLTIATRNMINGPVLPALQSVGGSVTFQAPPPSSCSANPGIPCQFNMPSQVLAQLHQIGGDLAFAGCEIINGAAALSALHSLGGTLRITGSGGIMNTIIGATGATPLVLAGIDFHGSTLSQIPLHADAQLAAGATAAIHDNPKLCQCTVEAFLTSHALPIGAGTCANGATAMCAACAVPSQCP